MMTKRIAFFAERENIMEDFNIREAGQSIFEPHYNIAKGQHIAVITRDSEDEGVEIKRVRWGRELEQSSPESGNGEIVSIDEKEKQAIHRAAIPLSGFYIWKEGREDDNPFFVRKIDNSLFYAAGLIFRHQKEEYIYCEILNKEANTLIQPITHTMPVIMDKKLALEWLHQDEPAEKIKKKSDSRFLITDITIHRVSKEVKDLSKNTPELIQPIPK